MLLPRHFKDRTAKKRHRIFGRYAVMKYLTFYSGQVSFNNSTKSLKWLFISGFYNRVAKAGFCVTPKQARKYFRSCRTYMDLYKEGASGGEIENLARQRRKHREGRLPPEDRQKSHYDRSRINRCQLWWFKDSIRYILLFLPLYSLYDVPLNWTVFVVLVKNISVAAPFLKSFVRIEKQFQNCTVS